MSIVISPESAEEEERLEMYAILDLETTGLNPYTDQITCIGVLRAIPTVGLSVTHETTDIIFVERPEEEGDCVCRVSDLLFNIEQVFTYNGSNFDIPFLLTRALKYKIHMPWLLDCHTDIKKVIREYFVSPKATYIPGLEAICGFLFDYERKAMHPFRSRVLKSADMLELYRTWLSGGANAEKARSAIEAHCREDLEMIKMVIRAIEPYIMDYTGIG